LEDIEERTVLIIYKINENDFIGCVRDMKEFPVFRTKLKEIKKYIPRDKWDIWHITSYIQLPFSRQKTKSVIFYDILRKRTFTFR
jgi:hypothetical protein